jgi:hypothetical protein
MAAVRVRPTGRAVGVYVEEVESWKSRPAGADACLDFEELVSLGNNTFDAIDRWDAVWHRKVHSGAVPFDRSESQAILAFYRLWLSPSAYVLGEIERFEGLGYDVLGAETFREHCEDVRGLLTEDGEFFGEGLVPLQDAALAADRRGETEGFSEMGD